MARVVVHAFAGAVGERNQGARHVRQLAYALNNRAIAKADDTRCGFVWCRWLCRGCRRHLSVLLGIELIKRIGSRSS
jgi:hypothetical protein